jgi:hypothetical protein
VRGSWPVLPRREELGPERLVQRVQHLGDAQLADLATAAWKSRQKSRSSSFHARSPARHLVQPLLQRRGEVVLDVAGEELLEEGGDQPALVLRE